MNKKTIIIGIVIAVMLSSMVAVSGNAHAATIDNGKITIPSNLQMGSFVADPQVVGGNAAQLARWFSASWGINQAYQVGAVDYPYQFLYGNFFQNGQEVVQGIQVELTINTSVALNNAPIGSGGNDETSLGAPSYGAFSTGQNLDYPIEVYYIQNSTVLEYNVSVPAGNPVTVTVPSFMPTSATSGPFYIVFATEYWLNYGMTQKGYRVIEIGEGEFNALNSHVSGTPTTVVDSQLSGASAFLNWTFSAGEWNVTFVHYLNNNPADTSQSNIDILEYYNFTYAQTGGMKDLRYNFSANQPSGVYGWRFHEGITDYGTSFIVYNNITVEQSGDKPPMISIYIKPASQGQSETISVYAKDAKNSSIFLEISVWYGNDIYTVPNPYYENVLYYFAPANVSSGTNYTLPAFTNDFYGQLNVEVLSHNIYNQWNNSYASSVVKENVYQNGSGFGAKGPSWIVEPFASPLNALFLVAGIGLLLWSIHRSGITSQAAKRAMRGLGGQNGGIYLPTHYMAAFILLMLAFINWALIFGTISTWGGGLP
ncbi:MAG: hypothetical protein QW478_15845 [Candidatus Micrarchaeaceae archaeon]